MASPEDQKVLAARFAGRNPRIRQTIVAGDTATTNIAITDIALDDVLAGVVFLDFTTPANNAELLSEASITSAGNIQLDTTDTSAGYLIVTWLDRK